MFLSTTTTKTKYDSRTWKTRRGNTSLTWQSANRKTANDYFPFYRLFRSPLIGFTRTFYFHPRLFPLPFLSSFFFCFSLSFFFFFSFFTFFFHFYRTNRAEVRLNTTDKRYRPSSAVRVHRCQHDHTLLRHVQHALCHEPTTFKLPTYTSTFIRFESIPKETDNDLLRCYYCYYSSSC